MKQFEKEANIFIEQINSTLSHHSIETTDLLELDHICWRSQTDKEQQKISKELQRFGSLLDSSIIGGRTIELIKMNKPLNLGSWKASIIELSFPKTDSVYESGFEHVEFVIQDFQNFLEKYNQTDFNMSRINSPHNPCLALKNIRFHTKSIMQLI